MIAFVLPQNAQTSAEKNHMQIRAIRGDKKSYFRTCRIYRYESPPTYAFGHILRFRTATAGGAACAGTAAVQNRSGHVVPDGVREDAFHNGTLTVKDHTVHIQYVRLNVLP
jgi:hypothetical protein